MSEPTQRLDGTTPPTDGVEERELRAVSVLLRGLPDPEPPSQLVDRVIAEVARREARPRVVRMFGRIPAPVTATALAAGVSCLMLFGAVQGGLLGYGETPPARLAASAAPLKPSVARRVSTGADASAIRLRRPVVPSFASATVIDPQLAYLAVPSRDGLPSPLATGAGPRANPLDKSLDRRLDRQLNHLLLDPVSFYQRIDQIRAPERFVGRLAERAAQRGDAIGVALRLRERTPEHAHTAWLVEKFLRAHIDHALAPR